MWWGFDSKAIWGLIPLTETLTNSETFNPVPTSQKSSKGWHAGKKTPQELRKLTLRQREVRTPQQSHSVVLDSKMTKNSHLDPGHKTILRPYTLDADSDPKTLQRPHTLRHSVPKSSALSHMGHSIKQFWGLKLCPRTTPSAPSTRPTSQTSWGRN